MKNYKLFFPLNKSRIRTPLTRFLYAWSFFIDRTSTKIYALRLSLVHSPKIFQLLSSLKRWDEQIAEQDGPSLQTHQSGTAWRIPWCDPPPLSLSSCITIYIQHLPISFSHALVFLLIAPPVLRHCSIYLPLSLSYIPRDFSFSYCPFFTVTWPQTWLAILTLQERLPLALPLRLRSLPCIYL